MGISNARKVYKASYSKNTFYTGMIQLYIETYIQIRILFMQNKVKSSEINSTRVVLYLQKKPANYLKRDFATGVFQ